MRVHRRNLWRNRWPCQRWVWPVFVFVDQVPRFQLEVTSVAGTVLPKPQILATGDDLVLRFRGLTGVAFTRQTGSFDLRRPGRVPQPVSAPPLRARAVAPPLGDMAVGSMLIGNRSFVQVSGPRVTLTLNNALAKDALMASGASG